MCDFVSYRFPCVLRFESDVGRLPCVYPFVFAFDCKQICIDSLVFHTCSLDLLSVREEKRICIIFFRPISFFKNKINGSFEAHSVCTQHTLCDCCFWVNHLNLNPFQRKSMRYIDSNPSNWFEHFIDFFDSARLVLGFRYHYCFSFSYLKFHLNEFSKEFVRLICVWEKALFKAAIKRKDVKGTTRHVTKRASNGLHIYDFPSRLFGPHEIKQHLSTLWATMNGQFFQAQNTLIIFINPHNLL